MKAIVYTEYGSPEVLKIKNVEKPSPDENELIIKIHATAVNSGDWRLRKAEPFIVRLFFGLLKPKKNILGSVLAGEVVETGNKVTKFKTGDKVFGMTGMRMGAYAEFICMPEDSALCIIPEGLSYEEAASIPFGGTTALDFLKKAGITSSQKVLIYGASGAVGTAAVQIAKYYGAETTGVCGSRNIQMVKSLGAHQVIDYTKEDFLNAGEKYDIVYETVGKIAFSKCKKAVKDKGRIIASAAGIGEMLKITLNNIFSRKKGIIGVAKEKKEDLELITQLVRNNKYSPVIDRIFKFDEIAMAHEYVEKGHKSGNVALTV